MADTLKSSYDLVLPFELNNIPTQIKKTKTIKIPNPIENITLENVTDLRTTLSNTKFLHQESDATFISGWATTPYTEMKQTVTLDLNE